MSSHNHLPVSVVRKFDAPPLCAHINRKSKTNGQTFRFVLNQSKAIAANVYLLLYPKKELAAAIKQQPELIQSLWKMLKSIKPESLRDEGRVYGGELYKMEPKELGNVSARTVELLMPSLRSNLLRQHLLW